MAINAVVFDIGGVLVKTPRTAWQQKWEAILGMPAGQLDHSMQATWKAGSLGSLTLEQVHRQTASVLGIGPDQVGLLMDDMWREYLGFLNEELYTYFKNLRPKFGTALLSNSFTGARHKEHERYGFEDSCDLIIYSHEVGLLKPNPQIYALACKTLQREASEIIFVDDLDMMVDAANSVGMHGVVHKTNRQTLASIDRLLSQHR